MTTVNTEGYVTVWFSPKPIFRNVSKVCWDQNITDLGGGKWTVVNFLTPAEYAGKTDLGYTSPDFPENGGASFPARPCSKRRKVFRGGMNSYTNRQLHDGARGVTVSDKAARYKHCVIDNGNGTLTTTIAQPNGTDGLADSRRQHSRRRHPRPVRRRQLQSGQTLRRKGSGAKLDRSVHVALGQHPDLRC